MNKKKIIFEDFVEYYIYNYTKSKSKIDYINDYIQQKSLSNIDIIGYIKYIPDLKVIVLQTVMEDCMVAYGDKFEYVCVEYYNAPDLYPMIYQVKFPQRAYELIYKFIKESLKKMLNI